MGSPKGKGKGGPESYGKGQQRSKSQKLVPPTIDKFVAGRLRMGGPGCPGLDFDGATNYNRSGAGNTGVFFLELPGSPACVIKGVDHPGSKMFCSRLAQWYVRTPEVELIAATHPAWNTLRVKLLSFAENTELGPAVLEQGRVGKNLDRGVITVMEFVPGKNLAQMQPTALASAMQTEENLSALGSIVALDILFNNPDRVACLPSWVPQSPSPSHGCLRALALVRAASEP